MTTSESRTDIQSLLPHRHPMLLVDEVISQSDSDIHCKKTFHADEYFFQGHYPDHPICPGVILCECGVQAGAILLAGKVDQTDSVPVLTKLENVRFRRMVAPGETIEMKVRLDDQVSNAFYLTAKVTCSEETAARFSFVCTVAPRK